MIARLTGATEVIADTLVVDCHGVGYEVLVGQRSLNKLGNKPAVTLYIATLMRQDSLTLYGFESAQEKYLFTLLLGVSGVGPKTALAVVDQGVSAVLAAVQQADVGFFTAVPRLGKKNAQKIIIELKSKVGEGTELDLQSDQSSSEVAQALLALGYDERSIHTVLRNVPVEELPTAQAIKQALQLLSK